MSWSSHRQDPNSSSSPSSATSSSTIANQGSKIPQIIPSATSDDRQNEASGQRDGLEIEHSRDRRHDISEPGHGGQRKRHRPTHSGGFLLQSPGIYDTRSIKGQSIPEASSKRNIAKEKRRASSYVSDNKHDRLSVQKHRPSIGSSPLANQVTDATTLEDQGLGVEMEPTNIQDRPQEPSQNSTEATHRSLSSFDSDPAQIVNLALNLSESRRRQFSTGRLSPMDFSGSRRAASTSQVLAPLPSTPALSGLRYHPAQQRRASRNSSPLSNGLDPREPQPPLLPIAPTTIHPYLNTPGQTGFTFSEATLLRADKARISLELSYEHRRLLQYLPRLPTANEARSTAAKAMVKAPGVGQEILGKVYNPLQYIRNRKVRGRERKPINSEADGWQDLDSVRTWIDTVAAEREVNLSSADDHYPLPSFLKSSNTTPELGSPASGSKGAVGVAVKKVARSRIDWTASSWDMLADVYWLAQDDHKLLIEDRDGHKLYLPTSVHGEVSRMSREIARPMSRRSESIPRRLHHRNSSLIADGSKMEGVVTDRGRRRHQLRDSITNMREYSSSRDRKGKWPSRFIRSHSSSSSEESATGSVTSPPRFHGRRSSRERQDIALLNKQVMQLLAKEADDLKWDAVEQYANTVPDQNPVVATPVEQTSLDNEEDRLREQENFANNIKSSNQNRLSGDFHNELGRHSLSSFEKSGLKSPGSGKPMPSIAINFSPSNGGSGSSEEYQRPLQLSPDRASLSERSDQGQTVAEFDFAIEQNRPEGASPDRARDSKYTASDGYLSPASRKVFGRERHQGSSTRNHKSEREPKDFESRLRGLLKGTRITDIVTSPVNKVGELIWRREAGDEAIMQSPAAIDASDASETDESISKNRLSRTESASSDFRPSFTSTPNNGSQYHLPNLPVFRSPFQSNTASRGSFGEGDHSGQQSLASEQSKRPHRFSRHAPPLLDTRSISSMISTTAEAKDGTEDHGSLGATLHDTGNYKGGRRFAVVDGSRNGPVHDENVLGSASSNSSNPAQIDTLVDDKNWAWNVTNRCITTIQGPVTAKDIARLRALILSSETKANTILCQAGEISGSAPSSSRDLPSLRSSQLSRIRSDVAAAWSAIEDIDTNNDELRSAAEKLSQETVCGMHDEIRAIEERIASRLTSMVRVSADEADRLGSELSTSRTLQVKQLNDSIDLIMRRRRRRLRWIRRSGYLLLEWTLLGLMWWVWLIVVIVRIVRGTIRGIYIGTKWLFWL